MRIGLITGAAIAAIAVGATAPAAWAQTSPDMGQTAAFGEETLSAGFYPDPHEITVWPGGAVDASTISGCSGHIAVAPDYQLTYTAGSAPLIFRTSSDNDTTLVINGPNGQYFCNDDTNGLNAEIRFDQPDSGVYDVWVGTYGDTQAASTVLQVTEITEVIPPGRNQNDYDIDNEPAADAAEPYIPPQPTVIPDASITPTYGSVNLRSGFTPDPRIVTLRAGGSIPASNALETCSGTVARAPDYVINYTAGRQPLIVRTHAAVDTTLLILDSDGMWQCDDDSRGDGDAQLIFDKPSSGRFAIWVGVFSGRASEADLILTERE